MKRDDRTRLDPIDEMADCLISAVVVLVLVFGLVEFLRHFGVLG